MKTLQMFHIKCVLLFTYLKDWAYCSGSWDSLDKSYPKEYNGMVLYVDNYIKAM